MKNIKEHIVVIAGASGGIGSAVCKILEGKVATIICLNRKYESNYISLDTNVEYRKVDLDTAAQWKEITNQIIERYKRIDVFINCVGVLNTGCLAEQSTEEIEKVISANLMLHIYGLKAIIPIMIGQHSGQIIEIGSVGGLVPMPYVSTYSASKFALRGLVLSVREEIKNAGVDISLLNPGPVDTQMLINESENPEAVISFAEGAISPELAAKSVIQLMNRPKAEMTVPSGNRWTSLLLNHFPNLFHRVYPFIKYKGAIRRLSYREKFSGGEL
jgi:short-subunit dehydrogenase